MLLGNIHINKSLQAPLQATGAEPGFFLLLALLTTKTLQNKTFTSHVRGRNESLPSIITPGLLAGYEFRSRAIWVESILMPTAFSA